MSENPYQSPQATDLREETPGADERPRGTALAVASAFMGAACIVLSCPILVVGPILGVAAIISGTAALRRAKNGTGEGKSTAMAGVALGVVGVTLSITCLVLFLLMMVLHPLMMVLDQGIYGASQRRCHTKRCCGTSFPDIIVCYPLLNVHDMVRCHGDRVPTNPIETPPMSDNPYQSPYENGVPPAPLYQGPPPPNNGLAVASLITGILSLPTMCLFVPIGVCLAIAGIVTGIIGLNKVKHGTGGGKGMALAGLICSIVSLAFIVILIVAYIVIFVIMLANSPAGM